MAKYDIRTLQLRILEILKAVDKVCSEHGLRYYAWAGTMLGAVRHKGFIPWDDDMDIAMPRRDYDILMQNADKWLPKPYEAICAENNPDYPGAFGKVVDSSTTLIERESYDYLAGIYIDIFPLDGMPDSVLMRKWQAARYKYYSRLIYLIHRDPYKHGRDFSSLLPLLCRKIYTHEALQKSIRKVMTAYDFDRCKLFLDYDDGIRGVMDKDVLGRPTPVDFENTVVMGVEKADTYLSTKYGDYIQVPDDCDKRQHDFFYLDYNLPYREYDDKRAFRKQGHRQNDVLK